MRRGRAGPVGVGPRETGVDRTPPRRGHAPVETPAGSTVAVERWTGSKRGRRLPARPDSGPARTERPRPLGEAWTTGAAQRALALEPGCFRYAYRLGHAARRCDVTRSLENPMETITSVAQTREGAACSLRTSRTSSNPGGAVRTHPAPPDRSDPTQPSTVGRTIVAVERGLASKPSRLRYRGSEETWNMAWRKSAQFDRFLLIDVRLSDNRESSH